MNRVNIIMYKIIDSNNFEYENGKYNRVCDIIADSVNDLPNKNECDIKNIGFGSFAWCISENKSAVLNSDGVWV